MPINQKKYHRGWKKRSYAYRESVGWKCERCGVHHLDIAIGQQSKRPYTVIIQAHHPDHDTMNPKARLVALCQACHLRDDGQLHGLHRHRTVQQRKYEQKIKDGQLELFPDAHWTIQKQYRKCNKRACKKCKQGKGHGPYYYAYRRSQGKLISKYIGKELPV